MQKNKKIAAEPKYHHGDLRRAIMQAALQLVEESGLQHLSLREIARKIGVTTAAPYHHFKDKGELMEAVAMEGWRELNTAIGKARSDAADPRHALSNIGVAYVVFATAHPALYRIMYDSACDKADMPQAKGDEETGWGHVRAALIEAGADPTDERGLQVATIAAWCAAHGVAEMVGFKEFEPLKKAYGGDVPFIRAVLGHVGLFDHLRRVPPLA